MLSVVYSRAQVGIDAPLVTVEAHIANGLPMFAIVGLPEAAVKESKDRVRSAIVNAGFEFPNRKITINLAPADLPKAGGRYDLPIALGILCASDQVSADKLPEYEFLGELALSGELRTVLGALPAVIACHDSKRAMVLPRGQRQEAMAPVRNATVLEASHLSQVCSFLNNSASLTPYSMPKISYGAMHNGADLSDIKGQSFAKRALMIAAAGQHNLLLYGPPGTGKTMLAKRLVSILPELGEQQALEVAMIQSLVAHNAPIHWQERPFRAPHHSASAVSMAGGGSDPRPGEISLAHQGILFLDELPEFERRVLEVLREPLESGEITISRARRHVNFPAQFQLIAAMNPCPCGYLGDSRRHCVCTKEQVARYRHKISGPLLDRIDMHVEVASLPAEELLAQHSAGGEQSSQAIKQQVISAHQRQMHRQDKTNAELSSVDLEQFCPLTQPQQVLMGRAMEKLGLSARAMHRIVRLARTIADLAQQENIGTEHLKEAIGYRKLDRKAAS